MDAQSLMYRKQHDQSIASLKVSSKETSYEPFSSSVLNTNGDGGLVFLPILFEGADEARIISQQSSPKVRL